MIHNTRASDRSDITVDYDWLVLSPDGGLAKKKITFIELAPEISAVNASPQENRLSNAIELHDSFKSRVRAAV